MTTLSNLATKKHKQEEHHNLEQLGCQEAQARVASWLGAIKLPIRRVEASHKSKKWHDKNHNQ
jgi:hypothetical protein